MNHSKIFYQKKTNWNWTYFRIHIFFPSWQIWILFSYQKNLISQFWFQLHRNSLAIYLLIARLARSGPRNSFVVFFNLVFFSLVFLKSKQLFTWCWWSTIEQWLRHQIEVEFFRNSLRILSTITIPIQWGLDKF